MTEERTRMQLKREREKGEIKGLDDRVTLNSAHNCLMSVEYLTRRKEVTNLSLQQNSQ